MAIPSKRYIGDAVYVEQGPYGIELTTENGIEVTNRIVLEPSVTIQFEAWLLDLREAVREANEKGQCGSYRLVWHKRWKRWLK